MTLRITRNSTFKAALLIALMWSGFSNAQGKLPRVGILAYDSTDVTLEPFKRALRSQGRIEGENVAFVSASARRDPSRFAEAAEELVRLKVDVIFADGAPAVRAAYRATRTIPIVGQDFTTDPVAARYAKSYARPGGNLTGFFLDAPEFSGKWVDLLRSVVPGLSRVVVLWDPSPGDAHLRAVQAIAPSFGIQLQVLEVRKPEEIDTIAAAFRGRPQALIILPSPMMYLETARLAALATKQRLPATSMARAFAEAGGVLAYGPDQAEAFERCATSVLRILSGTNPANLPIERPTRFGLVVNLKAAKTLNITIPESVLTLADKIIR